MSPARRLAGARVLITGGSSGIGLECARRLAGAGARLALLSRGGSALEQAAADLPGDVVMVSADVADASRLQAAVGEAASRLGGLDIVISAAGAATYGPFAEMREDEYRRTLDTTLLGMVNTTHATLPELRRSGGVLIVVGSVAGRVPIPWLSAYAAAKHGVRGFARSLNGELRALGSPVRVVVVAPGPVDTPFWRHARTPDGRLPPRIAAVYGTGDVAEEVLRAIASPQRAERTVGGLMAVWALADSLAPNLALRAVALASRLGWRRRAARPASTTDGLGRPAGEAQLSGGLASRPSLLGRLRRLWS